MVESAFGKIESLNSKVELVEKGTSYLGLGDYGKIMIGDRGFEFYSDRNIKNYIQLPWREVDVVIASIMFGGKWIPRFAIRTKKNGTYSFASHDPKAVLRACREHIPADHIVRSLSFNQVFRQAIKNFPQTMHALPGRLRSRLGKHKD
ncbi:DUF956 family protein [Lacticaseibacillus baoqingensis]|uniref:DUF956 family protein n=1 Tax=Lacticaseibacillus baoqingensis TaxID=2486013 RepID=A0ABW4EAP2_9LACO|nr:DUF956 family protein [Lacticaseibacillus baoqingensis]